MEHAAREGGASDNEEARLALEATAEALARNTDPDTREHLRRLMPAALRDHIPQQPGAPAMESGELSEEVARRVGCPREQGVRLAGAVLSGIHREEPELAEELASRLPDELAEWARDPDGEFVGPGSWLWATHPGGERQVGCVYTAHGLEYHDAGVISGPDLVRRGDRWEAHPEESQDRGMRGVSAEEYLPLAKNTYRVLMTRGMRSCRLYSTDKEAQGFLSSLVPLPSR